LAQRVLVTGASGFVGLPLCGLLASSGLEVVAAVRRESAALAALGAPERLTQKVVGDLAGAPDWSDALIGVNAVVHLAARVHVPGTATAADAAPFHRINVGGTTRLAEAAARAGVNRFVFVSSVKAGGDRSDPYSDSKAEAELRLLETSEQIGLECVIVRPPLVYGPRVRANFLRLLRLVDSGIPLPLGSVSNRRSLIYVGNLAAALQRCIVHADAPGQIFPVSDGDDISTAELIRRIARAMARPARLFSFPVSLLRLAGIVTRQSQAIDRLTGDLTVDAAAIRARLGWRPPYTMQEGLTETAQWYRAHRASTGANYRNRT
jgi:nucleoside-diphosphate-sugar epimerase